ncbi:hypothetical protein ACLOJK_018967, partial [Asimina triloba]
TRFAVHRRSTSFGAPSSSPWPAAMAAGGELPGGDADGRSKPPKMTATTRGFRSLYLLHQSMHRMYKNQKPISIFVRQPWLPNPPPTATICSILLNVEQPSSTLQQRPNPPSNPATNGSSNRKPITPSSVFSGQQLARSSQRPTHHDPLAPASINAQARPISSDAKGRQRPVTSNTRPCHNRPCQRHPPTSRPKHAGDSSLPPPRAAHRRRRDTQQPHAITPSSCMPPVRPIHLPAASMPHRQQPMATIQ